MNNIIFVYNVIQTKCNISIVYLIKVIIFSFVLCPKKYKNINYKINKIKSNKICYINM